KSHRALARFLKNLSSPAPQIHHELGIGVGRPVQEFSPAVRNTTLQPVVVILREGRIPTQNDVVHLGGIKESKRQIATTVRKMHPLRMCMKGQRDGKIHDTSVLLALPDPQSYFLFNASRRRASLENVILSHCFNRVDDDGYSDQPWKDTLGYCGA